MAVSLSSPVTGTAQTGLTSPTYTVAADSNPDVNGKQWAVTALGGTQTGVTTHSAGNPFTVAFWKPKILSVLQSVNPLSGILPKVGKNTYSLVTRKGVTVLSGQPLQTMIIRTIIDVPAGSDIADTPNIRAALSAHIGSLSQVSAGIGDTSVTGLW